MQYRVQGSPFNKVFYKMLVFFEWWLQQLEYTSLRRLQRPAYQTGWLWLWVWQSSPPRWAGRWTSKDGAKLWKMQKFCAKIRKCEICAKLWKMWKIVQNKQKLFKYAKLFKYENVQSCAKHAKLFKMCKAVQNMQCCKKKMCKNMQKRANFAKLCKNCKVVQNVQKWKSVKHVKYCTKYKRWCKMW